MIDAIQGINLGLAGVNNKIDKQTNGTNDVVFTEAMQAAKELISQTTAAEQKTTQLTYDFMTGKNDNIHNLLIAGEQSSILLQYTMQVRNQVLEAYREIMRIPV